MRPGAAPRWTGRCWHRRPAGNGAWGRCGRKRWQQACQMLRPVEHRDDDVDGLAQRCDLHRRRGELRAYLGQGRHGRCWRHPPVDPGIVEHMTCLVEVATERQFRSPEQCPPHAQAPPPSDLAARPVRWRQCRSRCLRGRVCGQIGRARASGQRRSPALDAIDLMGRLLPGGLVRDRQHRDARVAQLADMRADGPLGDLVEPCRSLVQDQQLRPVQECAGDRDPLALAPGKPVAALARPPCRAPLGSSLTNSQAPAAAAPRPPARPANPSS